MMRKLIIVAILSLLSSAAYAACPATLQVKDNAAVTANVVYSDDGSSNCIPNVRVNNGATPLTVGLPAGAATSANQSTEITALQAIQTNTGASIPPQAPTVNIGAVGISQTTNGVTNGVVSAANTYNTVAASTSLTLSNANGGSTGAAGDYLSHCVVAPSTTSPGAFTILDGTSTLLTLPGGASSVSNLVPFSIPIGAISKNGGWKIFNGANQTGGCIGKFS